VVELVWLIPALPLAGFLLLLAFGKRLGEPLAGWVAAASMGGSFLASVVTFLGLRGEPHHQYALKLFSWIPSGGFSVDMGFLLDPLSMTMALFVTGVATLIFIYAIGYMHGDPAFSKFFVYLCLFAFSMLMLVLGSSLLVTFLGWEGVGACSYWLVSFWFSSEANASAGKKAFITNRVGDWGFMLAMFLAFFALGSLNYSNLTAGAGGLATSTATAIAVLLFIGACGKSAQLPLYIWLPDAMAGPTPVSAMLHAATMVTAGVYLMVRVSPLLAVAAPWVLTLIAIVGALTALFAATIAVAQNDIKKVLAYSTVSQLGYMFLAIGSGAYVAAIFHMVTHAFFKALLFLGAGSVIHGVHEEQDMRRMGALRKVMPITAGTFIVAWLAIAGIPPFSGFWSKDEILGFAWQKSPALWLVGVVTAGLTAYYMAREVFLVFFGKARWNDPLPEDQDALQAHDAARADQATTDPDTGVTTPEEAVPHGAGDHIGHGGHEVEPHESPWIMTLPLVALAGLAVVAGGLNLPFTNTNFLDKWLEPVVVGSQRAMGVPGVVQIVLAVISVVLGVVGILVAAAVYLRDRVPQEKVEPAILAKGWYYDLSITSFMGGPGRRAFQFVSSVFDGSVVDGTVNGVGRLVRSTGGRIRNLQTGFVRSYALSLLVGVVIVVGFFFTKVHF